MKRLAMAAMVLAVAACAAGHGGAQAGAEPGFEPVIMYRVLDPQAPHPTLRVPLDLARELGVIDSGLAGPAAIDRLEAACRESNQPGQCRRDLAVCREKTCRIVAVR